MERVQEGVVTNPDRDYEREGSNKGRRSKYERAYERDYTGWSPFVIGSFIAAGAALLLAPQMGSKLRGTIRSYASRARNEVVERGREAWDTAVERGQEYVETGRQAMNEPGRSAAQYGEMGKEIGRTDKEAGQSGKESNKESGRHNQPMYDRAYESDYTRWSAFVPGTLFGAAVALLLAPQRGSELRGMMRCYATRARDEVADLGRQAWDTAVERGKEYIETGRQAISQAGQGASQYGETGKEASRPGKEAVQSRNETNKPEASRPGKEALQSGKESNKAASPGATTNG